MAVTIVAENVVHPLAVNNVSLSDGFVEFLSTYAFKMRQNHILMSFTKCKVIKRHVIWSSKIVDYSSGISNTCMAD